ncbi:MAG: hypothetical protein M1823_003906 [Watsoniomyces obsoletus]|nr:MAG: hypothetical protein M1823_003906 [Watsoniomyces obsoletus]
MARRRATSGASNELDPIEDQHQELGSMYDYLAKIILLGPSGAGKSCLLHRFVKDEWRVLSSQTIGVEFASKIVRVGSSARRKRIKLQLWDTAGTERFRSVSRSYYRGAAGALLVYDITSHDSFASLSTFLTDACALASPYLSLVLVGNKVDLAQEDATPALINMSPPTPSSTTSKSSFHIKPASAPSGHTRPPETPRGRDVATEEASHWASSVNIPVAFEVSARSGANVDQIFQRLARMILTKIELGEIDPDDPQSGIQYGDGGGWAGGGSDGGSVKSGMTLDEGSTPSRRQRKGPNRRNTGGWIGTLREWEDVFRVENPARRRRAGCCGV